MLKRENNMYINIDKLGQKKSKLKRYLPEDLL